MRNFKRIGAVMAVLLLAGCAKLSRSEACDLAEREIRTREHLPADCAITSHAIHHWGRWVVTARIAESGLVPLVEPRRVVTITDKGEIHEYLEGPGSLVEPKP